MCPAVSERYNRGGDAERWQGWQGAAYIKARGAAAKHLERSVLTAGCVRQFRSGTIIAVVPRSVGKDGKVQPMSRPEAPQRSIWSVRCPGRGMSGSFGAVQ